MKLTLGALTEELSVKDPIRLRVGLPGNVASEEIIKLPLTLNVGLEPEVKTEPEPADREPPIVKVATVSAVIVPLLVRVA